MNTEHTPGPWNYERFERDYRHTGNLTGFRVMSFGHQIAESYPAPHNCVIISEANARLIAAAPCILSALQSLVAEATKSTSTLADMEAFTASIETARAAIAKATGQ